MLRRCPPQDPYRGVAQPGSALAWGASGRWFKSSRPDHWRPLIFLEFPGRSGASSFGETACGSKSVAMVALFGAEPPALERVPPAVRSRVSQRLPARRRGCRGRAMTWTAFAPPHSECGSAPYHARTGLRSGLDQSRCALTIGRSFNPDGLLPGPVHQSDLHPMRGRVWHTPAALCWAEERGWSSTLEATEPRLSALSS